jgi:hypothetical protein
MTTTGTRKVSHFDHKSHRRPTYDFRGGHVKIWVRHRPSGLDRHCRAGVRTVLALLATGSVLWAGLGPAGTVAVASERGEAHAAAHSSESDGEGLEHEDRDCRHGPDDRPSNPHAHHRDRCLTASPRTLTATGEPGTAPAAPKLTTARTTPVPVARAPHPLIVAPSAPRAPRAPRTPSGQQPPLLAPPGLTGPSHSAIGALTATPVSIYVITVSALLVATAISIAALVLVRRSD